MPRIFDKLFSSPVKEKIQERLPLLFSMAQAEHTRGGKTGMEVGNARERVLIALFMWVYGNENIEIPDTINPGADVFVHGEGVSIKTLQNAIRFKLSWTVDWQSRNEFVADYKPTSHILFVQIAWGKHGMLYFINKESQQKILKSLGRDRDGYFHVPKPGTNPRGVEISSEAIALLMEHPNTRTISIHWKKSEIAESTPFKRWIDLWSKA